MMETSTGRAPAFVSDGLPLGAGDKVLFYSKSLLRLRGADGKAFGGKRLSQALHLYAKHCGQELLDHLWHDLFQFLDGEAPHDDLVVAVIERRPENLGTPIPYIVSEFPWRTEWHYERAESPMYCVRPTVNK
jgi:hypothetical protein